MKKIVSILLASLIAVTALSLSATAAAVGDANGDGVINSLDAAVVLKYDAGLTADRPLNADVNEDGVINSLDAAMLLKYDAGLINEFGPVVPEVSYGLTALSANGNDTFSLGLSAKEFRDAGFEIDNNYFSLTLKPMEHTVAYFSLDNLSDYSCIYVINLEDEPVTFGDCTVYGAEFYEDKIPTVDNEINANSTKAQVLSHFGEADIEYDDLTLLYGTFTDCIKFYFNEDGSLFSAELMWIEDVFPTPFDKSEQGSYAGTEPYACIFMDEYFDTENYYENGQNLSYTSTDVGTLVLNIEGVDYAFGSNGPTCLQLMDSGWVMNASGNISDDEIISSYLQDNGSEDYYNYVSITEDVYINGKLLVGVDVGNFTNAPQTWKNCQLWGAVLFNDEYFDGYYDSTVDFDLYGITKASSIENVLETFGAPCAIGCWYSYTLQTTLTYILETPEYDYYISIIVDAATNQIDNIIIF